MSGAVLGSGKMGVNRKDTIPIPLKALESDRKCPRVLTASLVVEAGERMNGWLIKSTISTPFPNDPFELLTQVKPG